MNYSNHPATKAYRQLLRKEKTPAEALLWKRLCKKQVEGCRFRQQHGYGPYVLDFYCPELRLCIEADGNVHDVPENHQKDQDRTVFLNENRIDVLRFRNDEIEGDIESVIIKIKEYIVWKREIKASV